MTQQGTSAVSELCFGERDRAWEILLAQEEAVLMVTSPSWRRGPGLHQTDLGFNPSSTSCSLRGVGEEGGEGSRVGQEGRKQTS